jgi:hypothetical protein
VPLHLACVRTACHSSPTNVGGGTVVGAELVATAPQAALAAAGGRREVRLALAPAVASHPRRNRALVGRLHLRACGEDEVQSMLGGVRPDMRNASARVAR